MSAARGSMRARRTMREMPDIDAAVLSDLFSESPDSLFVLNSDLRLVRFNPAAGSVRGFPVADIVDQPVAQLLHLFNLDRPGEAERLIRNVLETGAPVRDERFKAYGSDPAAEFEHSVGISRLHDPDGTVLGVVLSVADVTESAAAEARLRLLNHASECIGTTLDVCQTSAELCEACLPELADSIAVDVLDSLLRGEAPAPGAAIRRELLRRAGFRSAAGRPGFPAVGEGVAYPFGTPYDRVLSKLEPQLVSQIDPDTDWLSDPQGRRLCEAGVHSMMTVPLVARGVVLGLASFYRWRNPVRFNAQDLELAGLIGAAAALCLDNAHLYTRERSVASLLDVPSDQRPVDESTRSAVETAHAYLPAGVGGAWFDVIPLSGSRVALVMGDSTGLGIHTAAAMGELRAASAALSELDLLPDEILEWLHVMVAKPSREAKLATNRDAREPTTLEATRETCLYTVYDPATRTFSAASAGHPPPLVVSADGRVQELDIAQGPPLGQGAAQYTASEHVLPDGAVLLLHNDVALSLQQEGKETPYELLARAAGPPGTSLHEACDAFKSGCAPPERDVIVLLARTHALDPSHTTSWTLPPTAEAAGEARNLAAAQLMTWGIEVLSDSTELIVSELVTNAVRYAKGPIDLRLIRDRALIAEVTDDNNTAPRLRRAQDDDEGGRGLFITEQLTQRWGSRPNRQGKTIWAEQPLPDPSALDDAASNP